ncbi:hypothetical protein SD939_10360, partial [Lactobacillus crispatus]|uniref:hypothetical protein n=1 Tax=Lactobacillus crispatus TaxID=47770 RepID=UPI0029C475B2
MDFVAWAPVIAVAAGVSGIVLGWMGHARSNKRDGEIRASQDAIQKRDIEYIKRGVDDIKDAQKDRDRKTDEMAERLTRVEESTKQA